MSQFLLQIVTEEVPFGEQKKQKKAVLDFFEKLNIKGKLQIFLSKNRLIIIFEGFEKEIITPAKAIRGPKTSSENKIIEAFLSKNNALKSDLKEENGFFMLHQPEFKTSFKILLEKTLLEELFLTIRSSFSKTMFWNETKHFWIRPIKQILINFEGEVLNFSYAGIKAEFCPQTLELKDIIFNENERIEKIKSQLLQIEKQQNFTCISSEKLIEENCFLANFPSIATTSFLSKYLELPEKVLILTLEKNQKYFLFKKGENLTNTFAICIDGNYSNEILKNIAQGNEKVVNARLEDAFYYINLDKKLKLHQRVEGLKNLTFHANLGSVFERIQRMLAIFEILKSQIPSELHQDLKTAITLSKADLQTELTQSFPELQGYIGGFYASQEGYKKEICKAIEEHYKLGNELQNGYSPLSNLLAIIEKYEKITSLLKAGEIPTSSRDPFGIRKEALAIIKIIASSRLEISLKFEDKLKEIIFDRIEFYLANFEKQIVTSVMEFEKNLKEININSLISKVKLITQNHHNFLQYARIFKLLNSKEAEKFLSKTPTEMGESEKQFFSNFTKEESLESLLSKGKIIDEFFANNLIIDENNQELSVNRIFVLKSLLEKISQFIKF